MILFKKVTNIDFLGKRYIAFALSATLLLAGIISLFIKGLNFGIDFTGGAVTEVHYDQPVEISRVRDALDTGGFQKAVVQHFGTASDVLVRMPLETDKDSAMLSDQIVKALREKEGESFVRTGEDKQQVCASGGNTSAPCTVQLRRVEFVGPQVGQELSEKGGLAILYTLGMIMLYVAWRFEWRFAVGAVVALFHDVLITTGLFSILHLEFNLAVLAALLAIIGYSLNDTIVVFDRIRETFRKKRKGDTLEIMNLAVNETLSRTILTSGTTLLVVACLYVIGGESISGFSLALIFGIGVGTYSSIYVASPIVMMLGLTRKDMMQVKKEGEDQQRSMV